MGKRRSQPAVRSSSEPWRDPGVRLKKHPLRWRKLPASVKQAILRGVGRVEAIRASIAATARVSTMPAIDVLDADLATPSGAVFGRMTVVRRERDQHLGVELGAPAVIFADDMTLRGILLHEFAHCFNAMRRVVLAHDHGVLDVEFPRPEGDTFNDDARDRATLEDPADWFAPEDVAIFPYSHASLLAKCAEAIRVQWRDRGLPLIPSLATFRATSLVIPEPIAEHARALGPLTAEVGTGTG